MFSIGLQVSENTIAAENEQKSQTPRVTISMLQICIALHCITLRLLFEGDWGE
jgi:hypothetical protein